MPNCNPAGIAPYVPTVSQPWNKDRVMHLYRRIGFGATPQQLDDALLMTPEALIDQLVDEVFSMPPTPPPLWANWTRDPVNDYLVDFGDESRDHREEWAATWFTNMITNPFRGKLTLFWHNHFVTQWVTYQCSAYMYRYYRLLEEYAVGNFKDFTHEMGKTPAMLLFLNGTQSSKYGPNENYARELYELFTLGQDNNYTQQDIVETSKALTGWHASVQHCRDTSFDSDRYDEGEKTIFGQTGTWNYDDVHDILFTERRDEIAQHICTKIYRYFVYDTADAGIVNEMATTFKENNFELAPVFRQLFKSQHFFDDTFCGVRIKSPIESFVSIIHMSQFEYSTDNLVSIFYACRNLGQELFTPVNVAGWPGHRTWINENTITQRWNLQNSRILNGLSDPSKQELIDLVLYLTGESNAANLIDPYVIASAFVDHFVPKGLNTSTTYDTAALIFRADIPEYYFDTGQWNLSWVEAPDQLVTLFNYLLRLPEFQLA